MPYWGMRGGDLVGYFNYDRRNDRGDLVWNKDSEELSWLSVEHPVFLNRYGEIETWVEIATPAGAGKYAHLIMPFSADDDQSFDITIVGDTDLVESCPESAKPGETVTVITYDVTDGDKKISVSGADGESINWFEYQFVMPDHDVEVHVEFIGNGLA